MPFTTDQGTNELDEQASILQKQNTKEVITAVIVALTVIVALALAFKFLKYALDTSRGKKLPAIKKGLAVDLAAGGEGLESGEAAPDITERAKSADSEQIERFVDKDPAAVAQLLRNWLTDEDR